MMAAWSLVSETCTRLGNHLAEPNESIDGVEIEARRSVAFIDSNPAPPLLLAFSANELRKERPVDVLYRGRDLQNRALSQILDWLLTSLLNVKGKEHISMFAGVMAP